MSDSGRNILVHSIDDDVDSEISKFSGTSCSEYWPRAGKESLRLSTHIVFNARFYLFPVLLQTRDFSTNANANDTLCRPLRPLVTTIVRSNRMDVSIQREGQPEGV